MKSMHEVKNGGACGSLAGLDTRYLLKRLLNDEAGQEGWGDALFN